jgi:hypothetical protein
MQHLTPLQSSGPAEASTYRGCLLTTGADLLGQPLITAYRHDGTVLGQYNSQQQARRAIDHEHPKQPAAQGVLPFNDGAQLGPLFHGEAA